MNTREAVTHRIIKLCKKQCKRLDFTQKLCKIQPESLLSLGAIPCNVKQS